MTVPIVVLGIGLILLAMAGLSVLGRMAGAPNWMLGGLIAIVGVSGLFAAARSGVDNPVGYYGGLLFFVISVLLVFYFMKLTFDEAEKPKQEPTEGPAREGSSVTPDIGARATKNAVALAILLVAVGTVAFHFLSPWWWTPIASNWGYVDTTIIITFWITGVVFIGIICFMAYCVFRYRHQEGRRATYEPENKKLEWWLTALTTVGVAGMLTPGLFVWDRFVTVPKEAAEFEVMGQQWQFTFRLPGKDGVLGTSDSRNISSKNPFGLNPNDPYGRDDVLIESDEIHLPLNKPVKVLLRSIDVLHDFFVPQFRAKMDMVPGTVTYYWFIPTRTGTFDVLCFELCGVGHYTMRAKVVVEEESTYQAWLKEQPTFAQLLARGGNGTGEELIPVSSKRETASAEPGFARRDSN
ncbi:cytochrome c oxidase subunit II [Hypericibacter sp.]|uniref:cytochrome c oxidase subunit II n=1 Tax=Hypericibacter sp. TaxID=2705401 RepID=UPI003D6CC0C5